MKLTRRIVFSSFVASFNSLMYGLNLTVMECFKGHMMIRQNLTPENWSLLATIILIGALVGNLTIKRVNISWKIVLIMNYILHMAGTMGLLLSNNFVLSVVFRFISGIAIGNSCAIVPIYLANIAPVKYKGAIGALHQLFISIGVLLGQVISFCLYKHDGAYGVSAVLFVYAVCLILTLFIQNIHPVQRASVPLLQLVNDRTAIRSLFILVSFHVCQKMTGINAFVFFSNKIFSKTPSPRLNTIVLGLVSVLSNIISIFLVDRLGRRACLKASMLITIVSLAFLSNGVWPTLFLFVFMFGFYAGLGPITWMIVGDIFPQPCQPAAATIGVSINWILAFVVSFTYDGLANALGCRVFVVYFGGTLVSGTLILLSYRETRGKAAEFQ